MSRNYVRLAGVCRELDPVRFSPSGRPVFAFTLATQGKGPEDVHRIVCFGDMAAVAERLVQVDEPVRVSGTLTYRRIEIFGHTTREAEVMASAVEAR